jgi:hypothetical protein
MSTTFPGTVGLLAAKHPKPPVISGCYTAHTQLFTSPSSHGFAWLKRARSCVWGVGSSAGALRQPWIYGLQNCAQFSQRELETAPGPSISGHSAQILCVVEGAGEADSARLPNGGWVSAPETAT